MTNTPPTIDMATYADLLNRLHELRAALIEIQKQILAISIAHEPARCRCGYCARHRDTVEAIHHNVQGLSWAMAMAQQALAATASQPMAEMA